MVKNMPAMQETWVRSLDWEDPLEKGTETHSSILLGESHGQRSLAGYRPWGCKESDTTAQLTLSFSYLNQWTLSKANSPSSFGLDAYNQLKVLRAKTGFLKKEFGFNVTI